MLCCMTDSHWPVKAPTTITSSATNRKLTPARCSAGSLPEMAGAMNRPVPSHAVAIHSTDSWVCQVRARV